MNPAAQINRELGKHPEHPGGERIASALAAIPAKGPGRPTYSVVFPDGVVGPGVLNARSSQVTNDHSLANLLNLAYTRGIISAQRGELRCKDCEAAHTAYRDEDGRREAKPVEDDEPFDCVDPH